METKILRNLQLPETETDSNVLNVCPDHVSPNSDTRSKQRHSHCKRNIGGFNGEYSTCKPDLCFTHHLLLQTCEWVLGMTRCFEGSG